MGGLVVLVFLLVAVWFVLGAVGAWLAEQRRRSRGVGFAFGFFLGPIGLVIVALLPYGAEAPQMPTQRRSPAGAGALYVPVRTSPKQLEWKSEQQWGALEPAAGALPETVRDEAQTLSAKVLRQLRHSQGLRASLFTREKSGRISVDLLCDDKLMIATSNADPTLASISYMNAGNYSVPGRALTVVARHQAGTDGFEISFDSRAAGSGGEAAYWAEVLSVQAALEHFCSEARTRHWINVVSEAPATAPRKLSAPAALEAPSVPASAPESRTPEPGSEPVDAAWDHLGGIRQKLIALKELSDQNLISADEYAERKRVILDKIV